MEEKEKEDAVLEFMQHVVSSVSENTNNRFKVYESSDGMWNCLMEVENIITNLSMPSKYDVMSAAVAQTLKFVDESKVN